VQRRDRDEGDRAERGDREQREGEGAIATLLVAKVPERHRQRDDAEERPGLEQLGDGRMTEEDAARHLRGRVCHTSDIRSAGAGTAGSSTLEERRSRSMP
jgi:hypothetical protein